MKLKLDINGISYEININPGDTFLGVLSVWVTTASSTAAKRVSAGLAPCSWTANR